jgi:hypothetical protein
MADSTHGLDLSGADSAFEEFLLQTKGGPGLPGGGPPLGPLFQLGGEGVMRVRRRPKFLATHKGSAPHPAGLYMTKDC